MLRRLTSPLFWLGLACGGGALSLLLLLRALPYSSVRLAPVEASEANRPPNPDFALGPLSWPVRELASTPALRPFRQEMLAACGDARGIAAAECAATALSERSPFGNPSSEFVSADFDPVSHFQRHMAGAPGHCLTRSAIVVTELLAVGIPARVVQMVPADERGHTLVEVWDDAMGWTVVDPSGGGVVGGPWRRGSAAELLANPASVQWKPFGSDSDVASRVAQSRRFQTLLNANLLYPEPWLYLRLGNRVAPWPFRGHYARVGRPLLLRGSLQSVLIWASLTLALLALALVVAGWKRQSDAFRREPVQTRLEPGPRHWANSALCPETDRPRTSSSV